MKNRYLEAVRRQIQQQPHAVFCRQFSRAGHQDILWSDLGKAIGGFAETYRQAGVGRGEIVLIFMRHRPELYGSFFGAMAAGAVPSFMPCASPKQDPTIYWNSHRTLVETIRPGAVVTDKETLKEMREAGLSFGAARIVLAEEVGAATPIFSDVPEDAIGLLQHSSGTTGLKKGVALSYRAIIEQIESYAAAIELNDTDRIASWLPLYHDMGLIACMIMPAYFGITSTHIDPFSWVSDPSSLFEAIARDRGTLVWMPNFAFEHLSTTIGRRAGRYDLSHVRAFISCSEPVKASTLRRFAMTFAEAGVREEQLQSCYAMAETVFAASQTPFGFAPKMLSFDPDSLRRGTIPVPALGDRAMELVSCGPAVRGVTFSTVDELGLDLPDGTVGEISIRAPFLFTGYNADPEATGRRLISGRYSSGDIGFVRDGALYILGRTDDLIIINGRNIYAHEVEMALNGIDGLKRGRAVAFDCFDERAGSQALVILAETLPGTGDAIALVRTMITKIYSVFEVKPWQVQLVSEGELIKTTSGKISRSENRKRYLAGHHNRGLE